jgi:hypothetical protein
MRISPEMIEAAALAIRQQVGDRSGGKRAKPWNALPSTLRDSYRAEALAALTAALAVSPIASTAAA